MTPPPASKNSRTLHGIGISSGILVAQAYHVSFQTQLPAERSITPEEFSSEEARLRQATRLAAEQLHILLKEDARRQNSHQADILNFHLTLLENNELGEIALQQMQKNHCCMEQAVRLAVEECSKPLQDSGNPYLQERVSDIRDVGARLQKCLQGLKDEILLPASDQPIILLAQEIPPSSAAHLSPSKVAGFLMTAGSQTSHTAILARSRGIPGLVAVQEALDFIPDGTWIALDTQEGIALIAPTEEEKQEFFRKQNRQSTQQEEWNRLAALPTESIDGYQAKLMANISLPSEAETVKSRCQTGIGLFRTEFLFLLQNRLLSEEEQYRIYVKTLATAMPESVIFRTLDIGGDKQLSAIHLEAEANPFMGQRAIRFCLQHPEIFKTQLRALLRASTAGKMRILFPMITTRQELLDVLRMLEEAKQELKQKNIPFDEDLDIGCMVEVPAAVRMVEHILDLVDFISLGTNDLTQFTLAVDRANADVAHLYQPAHPAVLQQIQFAVDAAYAKGKWVSLCGEMAGDCLYTPLILGMGIHELSMSIHSIPKVKKVIRSIRIYEAEELVAAALACKDGADVNRLCRDFLHQHCPALLPEPMNSSVLNGASSP